MRAGKTTIAICWTLSAVIGLAVGCKGGKGSQSPAECMQACETDCPYVPDGVGDNDEYIECLEACEDKCGGG